MEDCHGCIGAIKHDRAHYLNIKKEARELAKKEHKTITIYRYTDGNVTLERTEHIDSYVTPFM